MVELKHHPGIVELPWCHERQRGVMRNQSHGVPESGKSTFPGIGVLVKSGRLILEVGHKWGDELSFAAADGDGSGLDDEDSPGPDVWARLKGRALLDRL